MNKFKAGDKVRRVKEGIKGTVTVGHVYVIIRVVDGGVSYISNDGLICGSSDSSVWELVSNNKDTKKSWSFDVTSKLAVDADEIEKELTYKNPLAIITLGEDIIILIQGMLITKAKALEIMPPNDDLAKQEVLLKGVSEIKSWVQWAKAVKSADWGEYADKCTVTITLPTI